MRQIAQMTLDGYTFPEIATTLKIDGETVRSHMARLRKATGEEKTWRAALMAALWGWLDTPPYPTTHRKDKGNGTRSNLQ